MQALESRSSILLTVVLLLTACGSASPANPGATSGSQSGASVRPEPQAELRDITLRLPFLYAGYNDPYFLALDAGFYREAGLNVEIMEGRGSPVTVQTVANGSDDFGVVDVSAASSLIAQDAPVKVVAGVQQLGAFGFVYLPPVEIENVEDILPHTIVHIGGADSTLLPAVLATGGYTLDDLSEVIVTQPATSLSTFLNTPDALYLSSRNSNYVAVQREHPDAQHKLYSDFGINVFGFGLIASQALIESDPDLVRAFVQASMRGWELALSDPGAASDAALKYFPEANRDVSLGQLEATIELLHTPATTNQPIGWIDESDFEAMLELLKEYGGLESDRPATDYFTNEFING